MNYPNCPACDGHHEPGACKAQDARAWHEMAAARNRRERIVEMARELFVGLHADDREGAKDDAEWAILAAQEFSKVAEKYVKHGNLLCPGCSSRSTETSEHDCVKEPA